MTVPCTEQCWDSWLEGFGKGKGQTNWTDVCVIKSKKKAYSVVPMLASYSPFL